MKRLSIDYSISKSIPGFSANGDNPSIVCSSTQSMTSASSDRNLVYEFKASLYERQTPFAVKLLRWTIIILYSTLLVTNIIDCILFYFRANDSGKLFDVIDYMSDRMNNLVSTTLDGRTIDLIVRDLEKNEYYGDSFYNYTIDHVSFIKNIVCKFIG